MHGYSTCFALCRQGTALPCLAAALTARPQVLGLCSRAGMPRLSSNDERRGLLVVLNHNLVWVICRLFRYNCFLFYGPLFYPCPLLSFLYGTLYYIDPVLCVLLSVPASATHATKTCRKHTRNHKRFNTKTCK